MGDREAKGFDPDDGVFRALFECAPDAKFIVDRAGVIRLVNAQAIAQLGYAREELVGAPFELLVPERFRAAHPRHLAVFFGDLRGRVMGAGLDLTALRRDGSEFPIEITLTPIESGGETFVRCAIRDITERRRAEDTFRLLLEAAPDAMVIAEGGEIIRYINAQTEQMFGYTRDELIGQSVDIIMPARYHGVRVTEATRRELEGRRKDGTEFPVEVNFATLATAGGVLVSGAIRDVSERVRLEAKLLEASRLKSEFLANMSHELRTPLNAIIGFAELIHRGKAGALATPQQEYLGDILSSARHLLQLINDVLDLAKVESGKMELRVEELDTAQLISEVRDVLRGLANQKRHRVTATVEPAVATLRLDPARLKQILYNFLSNAIKFTPEGGQIEVRASAEGETEVRLAVADSGIGIAKPDLAKLFVEFQQLDGGTAKRYQGTGLGLALTKRIVQGLGGRVEVASEPGKGSTFAAVLPRRLGDAHGG